jgi:hypothetical protein
MLITNKSLIVDNVLKTNKALAVVFSHRPDDTQVHFPIMQVKGSHAY